VQDGIDFPQFCDRLIARFGSSSELPALIGTQTFGRVLRAWPASKDDQTHRELYEIGFLGDEFMPFNWELRFVIVFAFGRSVDGLEYMFLINNGQAIQLPQNPPAGNVARALAKIRSLGRGLGFDELHNDFANVDFPIVRNYRWKHTHFQMELSNLFEELPVVQTDRGRCGGPFLVVRTGSRELVDSLLMNDTAKYHVFDYYVTDEAKVPQAETRDIETFVVLRDERQLQNRIRIVSHRGMYQVHRILRVPTLLEIMGNTWVLTTVHKIGWLVANKYEANLSNWKSI
jgi:hypothetical protein